MEMYIFLLMALGFCITWISMAYIIWDLRSTNEELMDFLEDNFQGLMRDHLHMAGFISREEKQELSTVPRPMKKKKTIVNPIDNEDLWRAVEESMKKKTPKP